MAFTVLTVDANGNSYPLDALGPVGGLVYSHVWPGGCQAASWTLGVPPTFTHPAMRPNLRCVIYDGSVKVWTGTTATPQRGDVWQMTANGLQAQCANYAAMDGTGAIATNLSTAVDQAITRGLMVQRPAAFPSPTLASPSSGSIADLANAIMQANAQRWGVDATGNMTMTADPTTPDYLYAPIDTFGRTIDGYFTHVYVLYLDSTTNNATLVAAASNPTSGTFPFGRVEEVYDITDQGAMTSAQAGALVNGAATLLGQRLNVTGTITVQPGDLLSTGGVPVRLSTVHAGRAVRLLGGSDTSLGEVNYTGGVLLTLGDVEYDTTAGTLTIAPVNAQRQDVEGYFTGISQYVTANS